MWLRIALLISFFPIGYTYAEPVFEENLGQWHETVLFRAGIPGGYLYITNEGLKYFLINPASFKHDHHNAHEPHIRKAGINQDLHHAVAVTFENAQRDFIVQKAGQSETSYHYFKGPAENWRFGVRKYESIALQNLYPGIDFKIYTHNGSIKYDFQVAPKTDPEQIKMRYEGASKLSVVHNVLKIETIHGTLTEGSPVCFQNVGSRQSIIPSKYMLKDNILSFAFPKGYDNKKALTIDPELIFSTYSGSLADNWGFTATFDDEGNLYSGGIVRDFGFPTQTGVFQEQYAGNVDVGILKFDSTGTRLLYATYLGGSEAETPQSLIVNSIGELIIYGTTSSSDFPTSDDAFQKVFRGGTPMNNGPLESPVSAVPFNNGSDLYLAKLSPDGEELRAATLIGGSDNDGITLRFQPLTKNYGDQFRGEVIVDDEDNIYIASNTTSNDFPIVNGIQPNIAGGTHDGVALKFSSDLGTLLWSTYLGGSGMDALYTIKVDSKQNVYVAGGSNSPDYPVTKGGLKVFKPNQSDIDAVVTKINSDGTALLSSTFLGTNFYDQAYLMEIDTSQFIYILGQTSGDYPVSTGVYSNPNSGLFVHKISNDLDTSYFSTVLGNQSGGPNLRPTAFLVNECENIFISGWGGATNSVARGYIGGTTNAMPITNDAFQRTTDGSDFYLMVLLQDAKQLLYGSYFGGNVSFDHVDGGTSRFDKRGIVYQSVCASCGGFNDFPTTPGAWSTTNQSQTPIRNCNNAVFKFDLASLQADFTTNTPEFDHPGKINGCFPLDLVFLNRSLGGENFEWDFGEGTTSTEEDSIYITYEVPGTYDVSLKASDINTCIREDYAFGQIRVFDQEFSIMDPDSICAGSGIQLFANGGVQYNWSPEAFLEHANSRTPLAKPDTTTWFKVDITNAFGCETTDSVLIKVIPDF